MAAGESPLTACRSRSIEANVGTVFRPDNTAETFLTSFSACLTASSARSAEAAACSWKSVLVSPVPSAFHARPLFGYGVGRFRLTFSGVMTPTFKERSTFSLNCWI